MNAVNLETSTKKGDLPALTGVRALAALWVVLFHFSDLIVSLVPGLKWLMPFFEKGWLGVNVFFVLSGFIITYNYQAYFSKFDIHKYKRFLGLRLARIYPVYIFSLLLMVLMFAAASVLHVELNKQGDYSLAGFIAYIFMVQGWADSGWYPWNGPAWSVSAEWFAYIGFPVVLLLVNKMKTNTQAIAAMGVVFMIGFGLSETRVLQVLTTYDFENIVNVITCFTAGSLAYVIFQKNGWRRGKWNGICLLLLVFFVGTAVFFSSLTSFSTVFIPFLILGLAYGRNIISKCLASPVIVYLGKISYSVYLLHMIVKFFVLGTVMKYFSHGSLPVRMLLLFLTFALVIASASITYHVVEEPLRKKMRDLLHRKTDKKMHDVTVSSSVPSQYVDLCDKKS
ncbi:acyltransferase [Paenibacillus sp. VCA1]|uniref:acyltransferase family protein n=1 Tax=Paenibacillus sp. VCA1 TaxID=3039148 RepID=UPI002871D27A|nr:acyltransferase [Paenibacillus sp. VCA1]MDR9854416.1 acyltransferase [Paenibacillus sp. VCA1]